MSFSSRPGGGRVWDRRQEHAPGPGHVILGRHQLCGEKKRLFFALTKGNMCSDSRLSKRELLGVCVPVCLLFKKNYNILEKEMATHSSILAWEILWTEELGRLQSMGL